MMMRMTPAANAAYRRERALADTAPDPRTAWRHLERAHLLAQPFVVAHVGSHVAMLRLAGRERDRSEILGQVLRIVLAGPASALGQVPAGNTGRAAVPLTATGPVPPDIAELLECP